MVDVELVEEGVVEMVVGIAVVDGAAVVMVQV